MRELRLVLLSRLGLPLRLGLLLHVGLLLLLLLELVSVSRRRHSDPGSQR